MIDKLNKTSSSRFFSYLRRICVPKFQKFFLISKLNDIELSGKLSPLTNLKFTEGAVYNFPFVHGRTVRGVRFSLYKKDVFSCALKKQQFKGFDVDAFSRELAEAYLNEIDLKIRDKLPIKVDNQLGDLPLWAMAYPWENISPFEKLHTYPLQVKENRFLQLAKVLVEDNVKLDPYFFGRSHSVQFANLINSISYNGFHQDEDLPSIYILRNKKEWRWIMSGSGNHRAYVLNYLNYKHLPAQIIMTVNRAYISSWPLVKAGIFSKKIAELIFDSVFAGNDSHRGIV